MSTTSLAVRFDHYGERDVLYVADVETPPPGPGEALIEVRAAGINPGEAAIRRGYLDSFAPATFPSGQGSDFAGVIVALGDAEAGFAVGDEVTGWVWTRASHAQHVVIPTDQFVRKPEGVSWEVAGALYVVGATAWAAVEAVAPAEGEVVAVSAAAGGVGTLVVQLLRARGARVLAIASEGNHAWLGSMGAEPLVYGDGLADRLRAAAPEGIDAFIDLHGPEYVHLAVELGVAPSRIDSIIAFEAAGEVGAKTEGSTAGTSLEVMQALVDLVAAGTLVVPIAATYPLSQVQDAFAELEAGHVHGKIVLLPQA